MDLSLIKFSLFNFFARNSEIASNWEYSTLLNLVYANISAFCSNWFKTSIKSSTHFWGKSGSLQNLFFFSQVLIYIAEVDWFCFSDLYWLLLSSSFLLTFEQGLKRLSEYKFFGVVRLLFPFRSTWSWTESLHHFWLQVLFWLGVPSAPVFDFLKILFFFQWDWFRSNLFQFLSHFF